VETLDGRLRKQAAARPDPETRALRDDLLGTAMKTLGVMGRQIHDSGVSSFTMVLACQQLGDLFRQHGQGEEALRQYREGCDRVEQIMREQPDLDQARGNFALMLARLGDISLDWADDARAARDYYRRALDVQRDLAAHPGNGIYKPFDHKRLQSGYLVKLGTADLRLGDPAAARAELLEALALRREWVAGEPNNVSAKSYLAEAHYVLGDTQWRLGDAAAADASFAEALRLCGELCTAFPKSGDFKLDLATVDGVYGDVQLRRGQAAEARKRYEKGGEVIEALAAADPENVPYQEFQALTYDRLARALRRLGDAQADGFVQHALRLHGRLAQTDPKDVAYRANLAVALARGGRAAEASKKAEELRGQAPENVLVLLQVARAHALCAGGSADDAAKTREAGQALAALTAAAGQGYGDAVAAETDPDLEALRGQVAFQDWLRDCKQRAAAKP
jgi:tetratricopeptide (TPR) repeat protein